MGAGVRGYPMALSVSRLSLGWVDSMLMKYVLHTIRCSIM